MPDPRKIKAMRKPYHLDRSCFILVDSLVEAHAEDCAFWQSATPQQRMRHVEHLRRVNYGTHRATQRLQRVLEISE